ncbi:28S ribosomal protein S35, mitochondrial [Chelonus insularis]|uniref:28S ribosomal protein S35, mitochondrial n=1 Tax=Chelonus insularis TaxID=460826 RepID=UPI001589E872|nr:28S ribosomal protein S35, mitochondrial [Chelonus insularis]
MSLIFRSGKHNSLSTLTKLPNVLYSSTSSTSSPKYDQEFRVLQIRPPPETKQVRSDGKRPALPPRYKEMPTDQDWPSVWPGPRTFHPAVVPLPIRQGYAKKKAPPSKFGNAELMKIPNFLHLTPPAIKRHCEALKQFCTEWPVGLETEEKCEKHFPITYSYSDYCYSSPTIREPLARIVTLSFKLSSLKLDSHAKDKFLRLVKHRYNPETDTVTIVADRCPTRKQNLDYANYLMTAVFYESWNVEPWEAAKSLADMEYYEWDRNKSRETLVKIHAWPSDPPEDLDYDTIPNVTEYKIAVSDLINTGEDHFTVNKYREAVKNILHLKKDARAN